MINIELPAGWRVAYLREISKRIVDGSHNPPKKQSKGMPMLSAKNVENNNLSFNMPRWITKEAFIKEHKRTQIEPDDVLLTIVGTIGRSARVPDKSMSFTIQRSVAVIKPVDTCSKYLMYQFHSPRAQKFFQNHARGTAQKGVYLSTLGTCPVLIAPLPEQHRIVAKIEGLFTRLDAGVEALKQVQAQLKLYRQYVLKTALEGRLTAEWREQHLDELEPADKLLENIQDECKTKLGKKYKEPMPVDTSELPELPKRWVYTNMNSISEVIHYGYTASSSSEFIGPKMLRITDIQKGKVIWNNVPYCEIDSETIDKYLLKPGDLVFARTGATVGKSYLIRDDVPEAVFASYLIRVILYKQVDKDFVYSFFQSPQYWVQIVEGQLGIGQPNVNATTLSKLVIPLPPVEEQEVIKKEIDRLLSIADEVDSLIESELKRAQSLRQSILKRAFEGKLVPQDPDDEPTSVLLERIKAEKAKSKKSKQMEMF